MPDDERLDLPGQVIIPSRGSVRWPNNARLAVAVTFDLYGSEAYRTLQIIGSSYDFAPRRGAWRVLESLEKLGVPATFHIPGITAEAYPEIVKAIHGSTHEVAALGYRHEPMWQLSHEDTREAAKQAMHALGEVTGQAPTGWRTPQARPNEFTLPVLCELGYEWDSTLRNDDIPYGMTFDTGTLVEIPVRGPNHYSHYFSMPGPSMTTGEAFAVWQEEVDIMLAEAEQEPTMYAIALHPAFAGRPGDQAAMEQLLKSLVQRRDVWFARCGDIAQWWRDNAHWA